MRGGLRGFTELRTRPLEPLVQVAEKRRCHNPRCGAVLAADNPGPLCAPCDWGEFEIPEWALPLVPMCDARSLDMLARVLRAAPEESYYEPRHDWVGTCRRFLESDLDQLCVYIGPKAKTIAQTIGGARRRHSFALCVRQEGERVTVIREEV